MHHSVLYFIVGLFLYLPSSLYAQSSSIEPIFSHRYQSQIHRLLELSALEVDLDKISSRKRAFDLYKQMQSETVKVSNSPKEVYRLYRQSASLAHFFGFNSHLPGADSKRLESLSWLAAYAHQFNEISKNKSKSAIAQYYASIADFGRDNGATSVVAELSQLKSIFSRHPSILSNINLLIAYSLLQSSASHEEGSKLLQVNPSLSVNGRIAYRLVKAMSKAGINRQGERLLAKSQTYTKDLEHAVNIARGAGKGIQNLVTDTAFFIWSIDSRGGKQALPFKISGFKAITPVDSYLEQLALTDVKSGQNIKAIKRYSYIARNYKGIMRSQLDRQIWNLEMNSYLSGGSTTRLRRTWVYLQKRYSNISKPYARELASESFQSYRSIVLNLIKKGSEQANQLAIAEQEAKFFIGNVKSRKLSYSVKSHLANMYVIHAKHREAVDLYLDLSRDRVEPNLNLAIRSQHTLAQWPLTPTWAPAEVKSPSQHRIKLIKLYERSVKKNKDTNWLALAQIGLLYNSVGQRSVTENLWLTQLKASPSQDKYAKEAMGFMFNGFIGSKRWVQAIELSYLVLKHQMTMTSAYKPLAFQANFANALFIQGTADLKNRRLDRSARYLTDFIKFFPKDRRVPQSYHSLAYVYKGLGKLPIALASLKSLIDLDPAYPKRQQVLLEGGTWSQSHIKTYEYAFFFYGKYLTDYSQAKNTPTIRQTLAQLYFNRKLYGWALTLYKEQSTNKLVPPAMQLQAAMKFMTIEERFGQAKNAVFGANRILELASPQSAEVGYAYAFLARYAASLNDIPKMTSLEPKLLAIASNSIPAREALGTMRFKIAELTTRQIENNEENAFIKDPEGTVKKFFAQFEQEKRAYDDVCKVGVTQSCAPSLMRLVELTASAKQAISKIEINSTLGEGRVNAFKVFKQLYLNKLQGFSNNYSQRAVQLVKQGTTTDIWKSEIIKTLSSKYGVDFAH